MSDQQLMSTREVAKRLAISTRTVWRKVARGELPPPLCLGYQLRRWRVADIERYLNSLPPNVVSGQRMVERR